MQIHVPWPFEIDTFPSSKAFSPHGAPAAQTFGRPALFHTSTPLEVVSLAVRAEIDALLEDDCFGEECQVELRQLRGIRVKGQQEPDTEEAKAPPTAPAATPAPATAPAAPATAPADAPAAAVAKAASL